jgi:hypothetical protein
MSVYRPSYRDPKGQKKKVPRLVVPLHVRGPALSGIVEIDTQNRRQSGRDESPSGTGEDLRGHAA